MKVINLNGVEICWDAAVMLMDDEIREMLHNSFLLKSEQEFFTAYEKEHIAKYGEIWELSKSNPHY